MSSIDERIVNMKFNNSQFLSGVSTTLSSLNQLKNGLQLQGATKGLEGVDAAGKKIDLSKIADGVEKMSSRFSALGVVGAAVLGSLATKALDAGLSFVKSLSGIDSMKAGFESYTDQINATQTILANVQMHGHDLNDVTNVLNTLQEYANKTVYSFSDMTKNISLFTAAGVDLNASVDSIKGLDNLAAASGVGAQKASDAMYQLSQAISSGSVKLQDWNSLQQAGLAGQDFQEALKANARVHGIAVDSMIKKEGNFRDSLKDGWLTTQVLTDTLKTYTGDMTDAQLKQMGYSDQQIKDIQKVAQTAVGAATNIRTVDQMMEALHEEVATAWARVFKVLIGDLPEATSLLTGMHNTLENMFTAPANNLAKLLGDWDKLGGRKALLDGLLNVWNAIAAVGKVVSDAFHEVFPPMQAKTLMDITKSFDEFTKKLTPSKTTLAEFKTIAMAVFDVLDIGVVIVKQIWAQFDRLGKDMHGTGTSLLGFLTHLAYFVIVAHDSIVEGKALGNIFHFMGDAMVIALNVVQFLGRALGVLWNGIKQIKMDGFNAGLQAMGRHFDEISGSGQYVKDLFNWLEKAGQRIMDALGPLGHAIAEKMGELGNIIANAISHANFNTIGDALNTGIFAFIALTIRKFMKTGIGLNLNADIGGGFFGGLKETFEGLTSSMTAMQNQLKADTLMKIAIAIGVLTVSVVALSMIDSNKLTAALVAISAMFVQLSLATAVLGKISGGMGFTKLPVIAASLILLAIAIDLLTIAVTKMSKLSWEQILKGLTAVTVLLGAVAGAVKLMSGSEGKLIAAGLGMIAISVAINILFDAVKGFASLHLNELLKGLGAVTLIMGEFALFSKFGTSGGFSMITTATGMVILAEALRIMATAVGEFAKYSWEQLGKGAASFAGALLIVAGTMRLMPKDMIATSIGLVIVGQALQFIAEAIHMMSTMSWEEIGKGLTVLAGAMTVLAVSLHFMEGAIPGSLALIIAAEALSILIPTLLIMGNMSWDQIGKGLVMLGASLLILALGLAAMSETLLGAAALIVACAALSILGPILQMFGNMSWDEIGRGLTMLAATLAILAIAGIAIMPAIPGLLLLGAAILLLGAGVALAGVGLLAFSAGLTALSIAGAAGTAALVTMVTALLALIPYAFTQIGLGIRAFAGVIANSVPEFISAMVALMTSLLTAIDKVAPLIIKTLINLISLLLNAIRDNLPNFLKAGLDILVSFLDGIGNNIGRVVTSAVNIIVNFLNALGNNLWRIINAGTDLIIKFVQGIGDSAYRVANAAGDTIVKFVNNLATSIRTHSGELQAAGDNLASAIVSGMTGGLSDRVGEVLNSAANLGNKAVAAIKSALDINSPSRKTRALGNSAGEGLWMGMDDSHEAVADSAVALGNKAISSLSKTLANASAQAALSIDSQPVIRPVLDLTAVKQGASQIGGMFTDPKSVKVADSYNKASYISTATAETQGITPTADNMGLTATGQSVIFNQNNYSPVALSATEIYRQTNAQLSTLKGGVTAGVNPS